MPSVGYATIQIIPSVRGIADDLRRQLTSPASQAGGQAGQAAGDSLLDKLKVGAAAAGAAAGAILVKGLGDAIGQANVTSKLQAQLGTSNKVAAQQGKLAGKLYSSGVTDSFEGAAEAIKSVMQSGLAPPGATTKQLEQLATKASDVAGVFDQDLGGVTNAVSQMLRTGLAKNADEAFDLITKGFQSGADKAGDFLDTLNEYGTQFRKAGIAGPQAIGLINQALKAGARDGDIAADAIKEFSIRAVDGSDSTADGFKALGLHATDMAKKFAKGGSAANGVLDLTLDKLRGIKDPVKQSQVAVQLFGTQAEDLGKALFAMDPSKAAKGLGQVGGAAQKAGAAIRSGPSYEIQVFTRTLQQGLVDFLGSKVLPTVSTLAKGFNTTLLPPLRTLGTVLAATLIPALVGLWQAGDAVVRWLQDMGSWLIPIGIAVAGFTAALLAQQIATAATTAVFALYRGAILAWTAVQRAATIAQAAFNLVMNANPIILVITAIVALGAAMVVAYQRSATFRAILQAAWAGIKTVTLAVYGWFASTVVPFFTQTLPGAFGSVLNWVKTNWPWILGALGGPIGLATVYIIKHWSAVQAGFAAGWSAIQSTVLFPVRDFFTKKIPGWASAMKGAVVGAWNAELAGLRNAYGNLKAWVFVPIGTFFTKTIPGWADTLRGKVVGAFDSARKGIKAAWDLIKGIAKAPVAFIVNTVYGKGIRPVWNKIAGVFGAPKLPEYTFATGGVMPGYTPGRDVHLAALSGGEAIMRPEWTRAVGPGYVHGMNAAARSGGVTGVQRALGLPGYADGGIFGWVKGAASKTVDVAKSGVKWLKDGIKASALAGMNRVVKPLIDKIAGSASLYRDMITNVPKKMISSILGFSGKADKKLSDAGIGGKGYKSALAWARTQNGKDYQWGGNGDPSWDCSGFMSAIESVIRGQKPHRRWATGAFSGATAPAGWVLNKKSPFMIGVTNAGVGHTAGTLNGVNVESRGGDGVVVGGSARGYNNSLFTDRYGFKGYADGGQPRAGELFWVGERGPELMQLGSGSATVWDSETSMRMAAGLGSLRGFAKGTSKAKTARASARKQVPGDVTSFTKSLTGSASSIASAAKELAKDLKAAGGAGKALSSSTSKTAKKLADLANRRDSAASRLATAKQAASDQGGVASDFLGLSNVADAPSVKHVIAELGQRQATLRSFQATIAGLSKRGLSQSLVQQLVAMGPDSKLAGLIAQGGSASIRQLNLLAKSGTSLSASYGRTMADAMYDAGANASRGFLVGLQSQDKELQAAMNRLGAGLVSTIKKKLKIHSPSRVTQPLGAYTGQGFAIGLDSTASQVAAAASRVAAAGLPRVSARPGSQGLAGLSVAVYVGNEPIADIARAEVRNAHGELVQVLNAS